MSATADDYAGRLLRRGRPAPRTRLDRELLLDLAAVLQAAPEGLRRWSVMRALRDRRTRLGHDIALKFEDEVERLFRAFCVADAAGDEGNGTASNVKLFFRPRTPPARSGPSIPSA